MILREAREGKGKEGIKRTSFPLLFKLERKKVGLAGKEQHYNGKKQRQGSRDWVMEPASHRNRHFGLLGPKLSKDRKSLRSLVVQTQKVLDKKNNQQRTPLSWSFPQGASQFTSGGF